MASRATPRAASCLAIYSSPPRPLWMQRQTPKTRGVPRSTSRKLRTAGAVAIDELGTNRRVHFADFRDCRDLARTDRPDRLISDRQGRRADVVRERAVELGRDGRDRVAGFAHVETLADAQDHGEAAGQARRGLGFHFGVALALGIAPFAVADDGQAGAGVEQHLGRSAAGVRTLLRLVDILPADSESRDGAGGAFDQDRGDAERDIDRRILARSVGDRLDLGKVRREPVHLPIAGDQLVQRHPLPRAPRSLATRLDARQPGP